MPVVRWLCFLLAAVSFTATVAQPCVASEVDAGSAGRCRSTADARQQACKSRAARALQWAARARADGRADSPAATIEELLDLAQAYRYGLRASDAPLWQALRADLVAGSRRFGLPFVAPELAGTPRFDAALLALTKRYTVFVSKTGPAAAVNDRKATVACAVPNSPVRIRSQAAAPEYPDIARQQGATGTALIRVYVDPSGAVLAGNVYKSAGNASLDQAALQAARRTVYVPAYKDCLATAGTFLFEADFTGQ
ncbi:MAG: energy transducer TonB [Candidatus Eremiobacteraeota bacterium]|nr:energy transducer TonB [Candidatus Eremiobacteraeota bacterium]MBC5801601.1 energy transducer TonB [Candidatus Eremiobacteraeota bacterium]MBC5822636.1 energy transducer TonB [Candidatus Eremiobacteraeota bacterium]